jgi:PAS domain S-box-containing protein
MSTDDAKSELPINDKDSIFSPLPSYLKDDINTVISSINGICSESSVLLTIYDGHSHSACDIKTTDLDANCGISLYDKALASDSPVCINDIDCQIGRGGKIYTHYFGVALRSSEGEPIGVLSLLDTKPYHLGIHKEQLLIVLAQCIADKLILYKKERELKELEDFSNLITNANQDYIFVKDSEYKLVRANHSFMELHPEPVRKYLFTADWSKAYKESEAELFLKSDTVAFEEGYSEIKEKVTLPNGDVLLLNTTKTRFEDNKGHQYILGVSRDISEREKLLADLQKSNQDLDEFAYVASHDLKAPLNAIERLASWIEEDSVEQLDEESKKHFNMIKGRVKRMSNLLSDLLNYSRIGREEHEPICLNLKQSVLNCFELLDIPEGFSVEIDDVDVVLPRVPLELVLTNLISNAIKHHNSSNGAITICYAKREGQHRISVTDDGPGISPKMHKKVFERFQTLKPRDQVEGSGMGLAMVQKTAQHLGGNIELESDLGTGSTFTFYWPI